MPAGLLHRQKKKSSQWAQETDLHIIKQPGTLGLKAEQCQDS